MIDQKSNSSNRLTTWLFIIYLALLCWVLLFKLGVRFSYMDSREVNFIPFRESGNLENILNILIFIPAGIYAGTLFNRWNIRNNVLFVFLLSLFIEGIQYILAVGAFDITDVITNAIGGIAGLLLYLGIKRAFSDTVKAQRLINIIAVIGTILLVSLLVLLKLNMLPVKYQ